MGDGGVEGLLELRGGRADRRRDAGQAQDGFDWRGVEIFAPQPMSAGVWAIDYDGHADLPAPIHHRMSTGNVNYTNLTERSGRILFYTEESATSFQRLFSRRPGQTELPCRWLLLGRHCHTKCRDGCHTCGFSIRR